MPVQVTDLSSDYGTIEIDDADNGEPGNGAIWDMSQLVAGRSLAPGQSSERRILRFRIVDAKSPLSRQPDLVVVRAKIYSTTPCH
jgi:hypothetical protein